MGKTSSEAALFRTFHQMVDKQVREDLFERILSMQLNGTHNKFEELCIVVLAHVASGKIPPSVGDACRDLMALILHSISLRTMKKKAQTEEELAGAVAASLRISRRKLKQLDGVAKSRVSDLTMEALEATMAKDPTILTADEGDE